MYLVRRSHGGDSYQPRDPRPDDTSYCLLEGQRVEDETPSKQPAEDHSEQLRYLFHARAPLIVRRVA
jgi:hypothetical protein